MRELKNLSLALLREGLPLAYVKRVRRELLDHLIDLELEFVGKGFQQKQAHRKALAILLGKGEKLSRNLALNFKENSFFFRHRLFSFLILPLLSFLLVMIIFFLTFNSLGSILKILGVDYFNEPLRTIAINGFFFGKVLISLILAAFFFSLAKISALPRTWALLSAFILAFLGLLISMDFYLGLRPGQSLLAVGVGIGNQGLANYLSFFLPFLFYALFSLKNSFALYQFRKEVS